MIFSPHPASDNCRKEVKARRVMAPTVAPIVAPLTIVEHRQSPLCPTHREARFLPSPTDRQGPIPPPRHPDQLKPHPHPQPPIL